MYCCIPHRKKKSIKNDISSVVYNYQSVNKYPSRTTQDHQQSVPKAVMVALNKSNLTENALSQTGKKLNPHKCEDRDLSIGKRQGSFGEESRLQKLHDPIIPVTQCGKSDMI